VRGPRGRRNRCARVALAEHGLPRLEGPRYGDVGDPLEVGPLERREHGYAPEQLNDVAWARIHVARKYHNRGTPAGAAAIVRTVSPITRNRALVLAAGLTGCLAATGTRGGAGAATVAPGSTREAAALRALLRSRDLWATIDVCNPPDQRNYVGIRGSMPADGHAHDRCYMSFRLQYMDATGKHWVDLASPKSPIYVYVGPGQLRATGGPQLPARAPHRETAGDAARRRLLPVAAGQDDPTRRSAAPRRQATRASPVPTRAATARRAALIS